MGKIRHVTKERASVCDFHITHTANHLQVSVLLNLLPKDRIIPSAKIRWMEPFASGMQRADITRYSGHPGSFGQVYRAEFNGAVVAIKRYKVDMV